MEVSKEHLQGFAGASLKHRVREVRVLPSRGSAFSAIRSAQRSGARRPPAPPAPQVTIELPPDAEPEYQPPPIDLTEDVDDADAVQDDDSMPLPNVPVGDHR